MQIAELNFGTLQYDWDDPRLADFQNNLAKINALAERSPGFIWRISDDEMDRVQSDPNGALKDRPNTASTLSVWSDARSLAHFAYKTAHGRFLARGEEWFMPKDRGHLVIWEIADGHRPTMDEGMCRWGELKKAGASHLVYGATELAALLNE